MKAILKITFVIIVLCLMLGCRGSKAVATSATKTTDKSVVTASTKETVKAEIKHFGDTLKGTVPLPKLTATPVNIQVESGGQKLEFSLTESSLAYKATPKHLTTTTIHSVKESDIKAVADVVQVQETKTVNIVKPWRPPWWWYVIAATVLYGIYVSIKYQLNPIKSIIKFFKL